MFSYADRGFLIKVKLPKAKLHQHTENLFIEDHFKRTGKWGRELRTISFEELLETRMFNKEQRRLRAPAASCYYSDSSGSREC